MTAKQPEPASAPGQAGTGRPLRADARRNRARVLAAARAAFAAEGSAVPLDEIARRAGVGAGTVHRHFPTKEALFEAIIVDNLRVQADRARTLLDSTDPGAAFFEMFTSLVEYGAVNRGFGDALPAVAPRIHGLAVHQDLIAAYGRLLARAQQAGAVRGDVTVEHAQALVHAVLAAGERLGGDPTDRAVITAVVCDGLRARRG